MNVNERKQTRRVYKQVCKRRAPIVCASPHCSKEQALHTAHRHCTVLLQASLFFDDSLAKVLSQKMAVVLAHELHEVAVDAQDHKHLELFIGIWKAACSIGRRQGICPLLHAGGGSGGRN